MEVIGVAGRLTGTNVGTARPVIRNGFGLVQRFHYGKESPWHNEDTAEDWGVGFISRFNKPLACPPLTENFEVFFITQEILDIIGCSRDDFSVLGYPLGKLSWSEFLNEPTKTIGCVMTSWTAKILGNIIAMSCLTKIEKDYKTLTTKQISNFADWGLCATSNKDLRWQLYSFFHIASDDDHLKSGFKFFISREFGNNSFIQFKDAVDSVRQMFT